LNKLLFKIEELIEDEEIVGIIPVSPKRLNMAFVPKVLKPTLWQNILIILSSLALSFMPLTAVIYILIKQSISRFWLIPFALFTITGCYFFMKKMFENNVKKYPIPLIAVCTNQVYFFLFNTVAAEHHLKLPLPFSANKMSPIFWINKNERKDTIGPEFEIKDADTLVLSGQLNMTDFEFYSDHIEDDALMTMEAFKKAMNL